MNPEELANRRRFERIMPTRMEVEIFYKDTLERCQVQDISAGGVRLVGTPLGLKVNDPILVTLPNFGFDIPGAVVGVENGYTRISFDIPPEVEAALAGYVYSPFED